MKKAQNWAPSTQIDELSEEALDRVVGGARLIWGIHVQNGECWVETWPASMTNPGEQDTATDRAGD